MIRKILKWTGIVLGTILLLALAGYGIASYQVSQRMNKHYQFAAEAIQVPADSASIAYGQHLTFIKGCTECHGANLSGQTLADDAIIGRLSGSNLTKGKGGLPADYGVQDWLMALRHGVARSGRPLVFMPSHDFTRLSKPDLAAIIAYCQILPPVNKEMPSTRIGPVARIMTFADKMPLFPVEKINHNASMVQTQDTTQGVAFGKYLTNLCSGCHRPDMRGGDPVAPGQPQVPNITATGNPGRWTQSQFFQTLRTGVTPSGHVIKNENMPWKMTSHYTDKELTSMYAYLTSLK